jgi:hypothetical protein
VPCLALGETFDAHARWRNQWLSGALSAIGRDGAPAFLSEMGADWQYRKTWAG